MQVNALLHQPMQQLNAGLIEAVTLKSGCGMMVVITIIISAVNSFPSCSAAGKS